MFRPFSDANILEGANSDGFDGGRGPERKILLDCWFISVESWKLLTSKESRDQRRLFLGFKFCLGDLDLPALFGAQTAFSNSCTLLTDECISIRDKPALQGCMWKLERDLAIVDGVNRGRSRKVHRRFRRSHKRFQYDKLFRAQGRIWQRAKQLLKAWGGLDI